MAEYYIKRLDPSRIEVAKFTGGDAPASVYTVEEYKDSDYVWRCECAATLYHRHKECRHVKMVHQFLAAKEPIPFILNL